MVRELGQPSLLIDVDRDKIARYGINVADVEAVVQAAVGGQAATQVIQGEKLFDLVVRMKPEFRRERSGDWQPAGRNADGPADPFERAVEYSRGQRRVLYLSRKQFALHRRAVQHRRPRPAERVQDGQQAIADIESLCRRGIGLTWGGEYGEFLEANTRWSSSARWLY